MATSKKATSKKTVSRSAVSTKASPKLKKTPIKKTTAKTGMRSFRVSKDDMPFGTFRVTRQTVYWVILVAFIIFAQLWIINLQVEVASLLDAQQTQLQQMQ